MEAPPVNDRCSVCHGRFKTPCQANCSHWFCGNCIMLVWRHGSTLQPCKCPLCRRQINLLVPTEASLSQRNEPEVANILREIETYNNYFGGQPRGLTQRMRDLPFLLRRLLRELLDPHRSLPLVIRARVIIAAVFVINFHIEYLGRYENFPGTVEKKNSSDRGTWHGNEGYLSSCLTCFMFTYNIRRIVVKSFGMRPTFGLPQTVQMLFSNLGKNIPTRMYHKIIALPYRKILGRMILSGAYVISPVDFIPEAIFGIVGLLDDLLIVLVVFLHIATIYRSVLYRRHGGSS